MTEKKTTPKKKDDPQAEVEKLRADLARAQSTVGQAQQALAEAGRKLDNANMANDGWRQKVAQLQQTVQNLSADLGQARERIRELESDQTADA